MKATIKNIDTTSVELARTIGTINTYIDVMDTITQYHKSPNNFWNLIFTALYDLIVIESFKLIDEKNLSIFSLIAQIKHLHPEHKVELNEDYKNLKKIINADDFKLIQHRHTQKAHTSKRTNPSLPRFADLPKIIGLLQHCENLLKKYNLWIKGPKYSINFNSIYAGGHTEILNYLAKTLN